MDAGDERLGQPGAGGEELFVDGVDFADVGDLIDLGEVHAGAEGLAVGCQQDGGYGRVGGSFVQRSYEGTAQGGIEGVSLVGTIESESQQAPLANGMQDVGHCAQVGGRFTARSTPLA